MRAGGRRVLVVEADAVRAGAVRRALEGPGGGFLVDTARSLGEYRRRAEADPPDIVLAGAELPDGRGFDIVSSLPEDAPFPVLILADPGGEAAAVEAVCRGALDYVFVTPEGIAAMPRIVRRALREWGLLREKRRLETELERREAKLRTIFQAVPVGLSVVLNREIQEGNEMALRITGYGRGELIGKTSRCLYQSDEEFERTGKEVYRQILETGVASVETRWVRKDGRVIDVLLTGAAIDAADLSKGLIFANLDITARKRAEEALRQSEAKSRELTRQFHSILCHLPDHILRLSPDLRILWTNRIADDGIRKIRPDAEEAVDPIGKQCYAAFHGRTAPCDGCPVLRAVASGEPAIGNDVTPDGRIWEIRAIPVMEEGKASEVIEVARNVTESRRMEERLRHVRSLEAVGRLAGGIAHDFNNMLNVILGYSEIAMARLDPGSPVLPLLQEIVKAGRRSAALTSQLLAFSRKQVATPKVLNLNESISEQLNMLRRMIGEDIQVEFRPCEGLWNVRIDPSQVTQILANLAVNARDAIAGTGKITIETDNVTADEAYCRAHGDALPGEYASLSFSDTGQGMDAETLAQIFEPFFTTKEHGKGTGLGLATVYGIVKQNGGFIGVYSEPGIGATFKICFPRVQEEAERKVEAVESPLPGGTETILLVEDEEQILHLAARILEDHGYRVLAAGTPEAACRAAEQHEGEIHLLLTDVVMPGMNGRDLQRKVAALRPGIRALFMSGYTEDVIAHRGILEEGVSFLPKPFTIRSLAEKVRSVLDA
jgi:PAS domain S-box-containing protein